MAYIHLSITGSVNLDMKQNSQGVANTWTALLSGKSTWLPISIYSQGLSETRLPRPRSPSTALPLIPTSLSGVASCQHQGLPLSA